MLNDGIPAIDAWCNPFTDLGIRTIFTENPEVAQVMGDQWGRHDNMVAHTVDEFVEYMDANNVSRVCVPSLKMMRYRTREMLSDIPHEHIGELQGIRLTPEQIVAAAVAEDVHLVGISILSGSHMELVPEVLDGLRAAGAGDVPVIVGGIIPESDAAHLIEMGVAAVFTPKDFGLNEIMGRFVEIIRDSRGLAPLVEQPA